MSHTSEIWIFEVIFIVFRLMKNIIFNKTDIFVGGNTCDHACQICCSKSTCGNMYHWFFLLEITLVKKMNNLNVCSAHSYLYPRSRFKVLVWFPPVQKCARYKSCGKVVSYPVTQVFSINEMFGSNQKLA